MNNIAIWYEKSIEKEIVEKLEEELKKNNFKIMSYSSDEEALRKLNDFDRIDDTIVILNAEEGLTPWVIEKIYRLHKNGIYPIIAFANCKSEEIGELYKKSLRDNLSSKDVSVIDWKTFFIGKDGVSDNPKFDSKDIKPLLRYLYQ